MTDVRLTSDHIFIYNRHEKQLTVFSLAENKKIAIGIFDGITSLGHVKIVRNSLFVLFGSSLLIYDIDSTMLIFMAENVLTYQVTGAFLVVNQRNQQQLECHCYQLLGQELIKLCNEKGFVGGRISSGKWVLLNRSRDKLICYNVFNNQIEASFNDTRMRKLFYFDSSKIVVQVGEKLIVHDYMQNKELLSRDLASEACIKVEENKLYYHSGQDLYIYNLSDSQQMVYFTNIGENKSAGNMVICSNHEGSSLFFYHLVSKKTITIPFASGKDVTSWFVGSDAVYVQYENSLNFEKTTFPFPATQ